MKSCGRPIAILLAAAMLFSLVGCQNEPSSTTAPTDVSPTALEMYTQFSEPLRSSDRLEVNAEISTNFAVGDDSYCKVSSIKMLWNGKNTEQPQIKVIGTSTIEDETVQFSEVFRDGTVYLKFHGVPFFSEMSLEDFTARWPSAVPMDESLYGSVTFDGSSFRFESPSALESWAAPEYSQLQSASATVSLDESGAISGYQYVAAFRQGAAQVELNASFTVTIPQAVNTTLDIPASDDRYVPVDTPDALHMIWDAQAYLDQASSLTSSVSYNVSSEAMGAALQYTVDLAHWGSDSNYIASIDLLTEYSVYDPRIGNIQTSTYSQRELFQDGSYSIAENDGEPVTDESVTEAAMREGFANSLGLGFPDTSYMIGISCLNMGGIALIEIKYDNLLAQSYNKYICDVLAEEENFLDSLASNYKTKTMTGYISINMDTGFPTASGISFACTHTIEDTDYGSSLQASQSYYLSNPEAYEMLTGEPLPEQAPEQAPTPLFYRVTGSNGQKMWLLGTIHAGDSRTAHLPQDIYTALDGSAALAVEFDTEAFSDMMEEDPQLLAQIAAAYVYTDGTTTVNHLDASLYTASLYLLKAAGLDQTMALVLKPVIWSQIIDDLYMRQGYRLSSSKGVDYRLTDYARSNGIPIRNVESGIAQLQMLTGFSDNVQEMLLANSIATTVQEYNREVEALYELWCQGDEEALTAMLQSEEEDIPQYHLSAYNEYTKAMMTDRNKDMLAAAQSYLESGEVIFYAVGLAHLLGEDGLVTTLRQAGYTVEAVDYAP